MADDAAAFDDSEAVVGARTATEMILCDIWSRLLGIRISAYAYSSYRVSSIAAACVRCFCELVGAFWSTLFTIPSQAAT